MEFNLVVCGGTFDHFHKGHKSLLRLAFSLGKRVAVGITSDEYVKKLKINPSTSSGEKLKIIEPFEKRKRAVLEFVKSEKVLDKVGIVKINDLFGPTRSKDFVCDALVVSEASISSAKTINEEREKMGLSQLKIIVQKLILASDGKPISSFRIRQGEIGRKGRPYVKKEWLEKDLILTEKLREVLKKPFGQLINTINDCEIGQCPYLITVGDATAKLFNQEKIKTDISVIDFKIARKKEFSNIKDLGFVENEKVIEINNQAGRISYSLTQAVCSLFRSRKSKTILKIEGEEDLAVLPLILAAPLGSVIFYGQPNEGLVKIEVSENIKRIVHRLVDKFEY